ncbi:MAG TPA: FkbM family methyltransferase [Rhizomicrobium sp.]|nr:FkbM family methyltransferase [Rhizomicrobium sp.]
MSHFVDYTKSAIKNMVKDGLRTRGLRIGNEQRITDALFKARMLEDLPARIAFLKHLSPEVAMGLLQFLPYTHSQAGQDLFVLSQLGPKRDGYFVEFGATDGVNISNSYFFEKHLGWSGIVAEPARMWHRDLALNRGCHIETQCVWSASGAVLQFSEVAELSTVSDFDEADHHAATRQHSTKYDVRTISLNDLLAKHEAPGHIDYLSIDTEGSEFDILNAFDFAKHSFGVITCEHNNTPNREKIYALLSSHGYRRVMEDASGMDDWYLGK